MLRSEGDTRSWILKALREAGSSVASEFAGLSERDLTARPAEGELSIKEIAAHLRDAENLAARQIRSALERPGKTLPHHDIDLLPMERDYRRSDILEVIGDFRRTRSETVLTLWGLSDPEWESGGRHPYRGEISVETIARELAQHDLEHLWQVRRLKAQMNVSVRVSTDRDEFDSPVDQP